MIKPIYNQTERKIIIENNSLLSSSMQLSIIKLRFKRDFERTILFRFTLKIVLFMDLSLKNAIKHFKI